MHILSLGGGSDERVGGALCVARIRRSGSSEGVEVGGTRGCANAQVTCTCLQHIPHVLNGLTRCVLKVDGAGSNHNLSNYRGAWLSTLTNNCGRVRYDFSCSECLVEATRDEFDDWIRYCGLTNLGC